VDVQVGEKDFKYSDALPGGVPPLMAKVLEAAGSAYNVPASVLLGTMLEEGAFSHADVWKWTDDTVREFSDCTQKDPMKYCYDEGFASGEGAAPPFGFIENWWNNYIESGGPYKKYADDPVWKEVLDAIPEENISRCNFVDAAFTAARELGEDQSHKYVDGLPLACPVGSSVVTVYQGGDPPGSCDVWTKERVALSRLQYAERECSDQISRMVQTYEGF